jgi:hypothetical protein
MATKRNSKKAEVAAEVPAFVPISTGSFESVVKATEAGSFCYTSPDVHAPLAAQGLVEINPALVDEAGNVATRATESGIALSKDPVVVESEAIQTPAVLTELEPEKEIPMSEAIQTPAVLTELEPEKEIPMSEAIQTPVSIPAATRRVFAVESGIEIPDGRQGGRAGETYPFGQLEIGQSFMVPADEKRPNPVKDFASTVSSANGRYAVPHPDGTMRKNRKGADVPVMVETRKFVIRAVVGGARVWRTA